MIICPCCGFKFEGDLHRGCEACGACAVGEPLPRPAHELPSYGRSLLLVVTGALMVLAFFVQTVLALVQRLPLSFGFWSWVAAAVAAAETAAWHLKWISLPVTVVVLWGGSRIYRRMQQSPSRFVGLRFARAGLTASALVSLMIATAIGVTVPERVRQHQDAIEAASYAQGYTIQRALLEYRALHGTLPADVRDLLHLDDPDGSIAAALNNLGPIDPVSASAWYKTSVQLAESLPKDKTRRLRGAVLRNASAVTDDTMDGGLSFTNYELRLPGEDKILNTDDDFIMRDGVIMKASQAATATVSAKRKPSK